MRWRALPTTSSATWSAACPLETGVIDAKAVCARFRAAGYAGPCMIEPFEPARTRFAAMSAEEAVDAAGAVFRKLDLL